MAAERARRVAGAWCRYGWDCGRGRSNRGVFLLNTGKEQEDGGDLMSLYTVKVHMLTLQLTRPLLFRKEIRSALIDLTRPSPIRAHYIHIGLNVNLFWTIPRATRRALSTRWRPSPGSRRWARLS